MLDDLHPILTQVKAESDVVIHPIGDLHYGSPQFNLKMWEKTLAELSKPDHYCVLVGDMINNATKNSISNVYEETCSPSVQKRWLAEQLKPYKDKILCGTGGNHERRSVKDVDDNPLYDVFSKLDIEERYRENAAFLILRVNYDRRQDGKDRPTYVICVSHGAGNGMYIGSSANRVERFGMALDGVDLVITGHTHKPLTFPAAKLFVDSKNKKVLIRQFQVVTCSSYLDYGGYPIQKLLTPTAIKPNEIHLSIKGKEIKVIQ